MVRATLDYCKRCIYRVGFGPSPGQARERENYCCNYLAIEGHSRIFKNGEYAYDPELCDKFVEGPQITGEDSERCDKVIGLIEGIGDHE